jgi:hypothetical protein
MDYIKKTYSSNGFQYALPWIILIIGLLFFILSITVTFKNENWQHIFEGLGKTMLTGGIFAVLLKSMQFMGIFKDELTNILFEPKSLENRIDLPIFWEKTSRVLFRNKFPKISEKLLNDVKEMYFPTKEVSYYENAEHNIEIRLDPPNIIRMIDTVTLDVICESPTTNTNYTFGGSVDANSTYKLISFKLDGTDMISKYKPIKKQINGRNHEAVDIKLSGKTKYHIEKIEEEITNLDLDDLMIFRAKKIFFRLKVQIHHDSNLDIDFHSCGTLVSFKLTKSNINYKEYYCDGLIYPEQGYFYKIKIK